jgi:gliding motility-associated-like protein
MMAQCLSYSQTLFPDRHRSLFKEYGSQIGAYDDYLVVNEPFSDSFEEDGGAVYVYKLSEGYWNKIGELTQKQPMRGNELGRKLAISENIIVGSSINYTVEGNHSERLVVYHKNEEEDWKSSSEDYLIELSGNLEDSPRVGWFILDMDFNGTTLAVSQGLVAENGRRNYRVSIFENVDDSLRLEKEIYQPEEHSSQNMIFGSNIKLEDNFLAVLGDQYSTPDNLGVSGALFIFDKFEGGWKSSPSIKIVPEKRQEGNVVFGQAIDTSVDSIFVGSYDNGQPVIYGYSKTNGNWRSEPSSYIAPAVSGNHNLQMALDVDGNNIFLSQNSSDSLVYILEKKSNDWNGDVSLNIIKNPRSGQPFGRKVLVHQNHLFVAATQYPVEPFSNFVASYFAPNSSWGNVSSPSQIIEELKYNSANDEFGKSMSFSGNQLAISAYGDDSGGKHAGSVYLYETSEGQLTQQLRVINTDIRNVNGFGRSVYLDDDLLFISNPGYSTFKSDGSYEFYNLGKVDVYKISGASAELIAEILPPVKKRSASFGQSVVYHNGYLAVCEFDRSSSINVGKVHIYEASENYRKWSNIATLRPSDDTKGDYFGRSMALNDSLLVIGTGSEELNGSEFKVYVFVKDGVWKDRAEDARLVPANKVHNDYFGYDVGLYGDVIVVGAPLYHTEAFGHNGRAYLFKKPKKGWLGTINEVAEFYPNNNSPLSAFGTSVAVDNEKIYIGAPSAGFFSFNNVVNFNSGDLLAGKVFVYSKVNGDWSSGIETTSFTSPTPEPLDGFGGEIGLSNEKLFVSSMFDNTVSGFRTGSVDVYDLEPAIIISKKIVCQDEGPTELAASPSGGKWSGAGIIDDVRGIFDPAGLAPGVYEVQYEVEGCTSSVLVPVRPKIPVFSTSPNQIKKCSGDIVELTVEASNEKLFFKWRFEPYGTADGFENLYSFYNQKTISITEPGEYICEIYGNYCQSVFASFMVENDLTYGRLNHNDSVFTCREDSIELNLVAEGEIKHMSWFFSPAAAGQFSEISQNTKVFPQESGKYFSVYNSELCAFHSDTVAITFGEVALSVESIPTICSDEQVIPLSGLPEGGVWSGPGVDSSGSQFQAEMLENGEYPLIYAYQEAGCLYTKSTQVDVEILEIPEISYSTHLLCLGNPIELVINNSQQASRFEWRIENSAKVLGNGSSFETGLPGKYLVELFKHTCSITSDIVALEYEEESLFVPNAFTPNNDGYNDNFEVLWSGIGSFNLKIMDRNGKTLFTSSDPGFKWDGKGFPSGVYFWHIDYVSCANENRSFRGTVNLLN